MTPEDLNYRHLLYFWTVAKEGSITRAGQRLGLSVQTISTQLRQLESQLGHALLAPQGRSLVLTDTGRIALEYAEQIFQLGGKLRHALVECPTNRPRFAVGVTDAVPKLVTFRLLEIVMQPPLSVRLECSEGNFESLLAELALNRLDLVIADQSAPHSSNLKLNSHFLIKVEIALYASTAMEGDHYASDFPKSLNDAPLLLPQQGNPLRGAIDAWFAERELRPLVVGEFADSALMKTFGRAGLGLFPAPASMRDDIASQFGANPVGTLHGVRESWYAISAHRRVAHPAISLIQSSGSYSLAD